MLYGAAKMEKSRKVAIEVFFFLTLWILFSFSDWLWQINAAVRKQNCSSCRLSLTFVLELIV